MKNQLDNPPELIRLNTAAKRIGVTPYVLKGAMINREIPIDPVRIGKTFFVKSVQLKNWLTPKPDALEDLFFQRQSKL